jgi:ligand-binding SRPBCC domain-containing protein
MRHFMKESRIAAPRSVVFGFHERPDALERLIPPWERVEVVDAPRSLQPGSRVVLRMAFGPLRFDWIAEHTEYIHDRLFVDRQVKGPFAFWLHRHCFEDDGQGGTILRDEVEYRPFLGTFGEIVAGRFLKSKLERMFEYRHQVTKRACEQTADADATATGTGGTDFAESKPDLPRRVGGFS